MINYAKFGTETIWSNEANSVIIQGPIKWTRLKLKQLGTEEKCVDDNLLHKSRSPPITVFTLSTLVTH